MTARDRLAENVQRVRARIADAARAAGRDTAEITLVAVTKYVEPPVVALLAECGCLDLGESRPQELWRKCGATSVPGVRWHLVGHLQRNKVARTLPLVCLVHSVDSLRLLEAIDAEVHRSGSAPAEVLLEVNVSGEETKQGLAPATVPDILAGAVPLSGVRCRGLMTMAPLAGGIDAARRAFAELRELRDQVRDRARAGRELPVLSMGMSGDFEAAIAEGSTHVRIGSALFDGLSPGDGVREGA
jgi:hypothetical protein